VRNEYGTLKAASYLALFIAALALLTAGTGAAVNLDIVGDYEFSVAETDMDYIVTVYGREVTPEGQNVYIGFYFYAVHSACPEETNSLCCDNLILLEDDSGVAHEPTSVHIPLNQGFYESSRPFVKYKYAGDFAGSCKLVVKLGDGEIARLDLGPAEYDFYRMGTVTARDGVAVHLAPDYVSPVLCELRPGDTFYFTGRESYFWPDSEFPLNDIVNFEEVICGGSRGWLTPYDNKKRSEYVDKYGKEPPDELIKSVEPGDFTPRYLPHGRVGTAGGGGNGTNGE
jgi:hypothetical protein